MNYTPVTFSLLLLCSLLFLAESAGGYTLFDWFALWPLGSFGAAASAGSQFYPWQLLTYAVLHGSPLHLILNLYALWLFGVPLERRWGPRRFAFFFGACVVGAALAHLAVAAFALTQGGAVHPVVGASGGVFGLLLAFGLIYPDVELMLLFPPIPIKALWFAVGYGVVELAAGVAGTSAGIAHFAHLGGMLTGYLLLRGASWFR